MRTDLRAVLLVSVLVLVSAACSSAGGPVIPPLTPPGSQPGGGSVGSGGDPGVGTDEPVGSGPGGPVQPGDGRPTMVVPKPGRLDVRPVGATKIEAMVTGRDVVVRLTWWSGVEPCSVLDSVGVTTSGSDIQLSIREGADRRGVMCIEIAMLKATLVDLGELAPGTYTISAGGQAPPIQVVVS